MYKKVLVPLDGSALAECSLNHVKALVKEGSAGEVILLNVVKVDIPWAEIKEKVLDLEALRAPLFAASRKYLEETASRLSAEGIVVKTVSLEGNRPGETIADYARENAVSLVVITTHGFTGFKRLMLGSVALHLLQESHAPVLLVRPESCCVR